MRESKATQILRRRLEAAGCCVYPGALKYHAGFPDRYVTHRSWASFGGACWVEVKVSTGLRPLQRVVIGRLREHNVPVVVLRVRGCSYLVDLGPIVVELEWVPGDSDREIGRALVETIREHFQ